MSPKTREEYKRLKLEEKKKAEALIKNEKKAQALKKEEEKKQAKALKENEEDKEKILHVKKVRVRLIPIWLRLVILLVLILFSVTAGALVGYGPVGGGKATDIFKESTWTHIQDLINKKK